jgi:valyl-tRNA synthetase
MENKHIPEKLLTPYDPQTTERHVYDVWENSGYFNPDICIRDGITKADAKPFTIVMPPPNVTGILHMGHAMMLAIQDIMIRYHRMKGEKALWIPGTDHAAIATQSKVEKEISKKEGKSRYDLGREEMLKRIHTFAQDSHDSIIAQVKTMGASCDWSREAFTLDEARTKAVYTMFKNMYDDGLIYRGTRVVNWDPKGQTTIADDEIVYEERKAKLYTFKYAKDFPIAISTTRPETKIGDVAVAVHPSDERYTAYVGKEYDMEFCGVAIHIKIIADESVEKDFGTGALGVTPAHSMIDADIAKRHNLPSIQVINEYAKMTLGGENILGKKTTEAREVMVSWLRDEGLLEKEEEVNQNVSTAERTGGIIEPLPKLQWFIDVNKEFILPESALEGIASGSKTTLKQIMRTVVQNKQVTIVPEYFDKTYFHWIDNLQDWCISRQIWYGHRIPVWYKGDEIYSDIQAPEGEGWVQDEDVLDTWFSSGLWTFSTLGWPDNTPDLATYHPTAVLETGYEILFSWVARMILMTGYGLGTIPFHTVYLHGTVRDAQGRKMSKSLGNGIDPIDVANKFGIDAGRMALITGTAPGTDSRIDENKIKGYKNFANKLWNITRFVMTNTEGFQVDTEKSNYTEEDQVLQDEVRTLAIEVGADINALRFHLASEKIYHYIWHRFADVILEESKEIFTGTDTAKISSRKQFLMNTLADTLKILHPFMPFVTEELWSIIPRYEANSQKLLIIESWPFLENHTH